MAEVNPNRYKSNSYKSKAEEEVSRTPVIQSGQARKHKKTFFDKFKESALGDTNAESFSDLILDIAVPALKDTLSDVICNSVDILLFGEPRRGRSGSRGGKGADIQYNHVAKRERDREVARGRRAVFDFSGLEFTSRVAAEEVLVRCKQELYEEGQIPVAAMYEYAGRGEDISPTDWNYGWTNLDDVEVYPRYDGMYVFRYLPHPRQMK